jgi:hypothetical protein
LGNAGVRRFFIPFQVSLSLVLVVVAALLGSTVVRLRTDNSGYRTAHVFFYIADFNRVPQKGADIIPLYRRIVARMEEMPGIEDASVVEIPPLHDWGDDGMFVAAEDVRHGQPTEASPNYIGAHFFAAVGTPLLACYASVFSIRPDQPVPNATQGHSTASPNVRQNPNSDQSYRRGLLILKRSPEKHRSPRLKVRKRRGESGLNRTSFAAYYRGVTQGEGGGGGTTGGRSLQVIVLGSSHGASQGPVVPPPTLPPRSISVNSDPAGVKWNEPQLLTPTAPTLRASTFSKVAEPATRALTTEVPVPSTRSSLKCTFVIV